MGNDSEDQGAVGLLIAAYASGDVDVLIPPRMAPRARGV